MDPLEFGWWLASRAAGILALLCIAASVGLGLAMAGRVARRPGLHALHQHTALIGLVAIAVHGITLLGDRHLAPSLGDPRALLLGAQPDRAGPVAAAAPGDRAGLRARGRAHARRGDGRRRAVDA